MLPKILMPIKEYSLIRVGKNFDGGYLIGKKSIENSDVLLTFGVGDDCSFERNFLKINPKARIFLYDNTVKNFWIKKLKRSCYKIFRLNPEILKFIFELVFFVAFFFKNNVCLYKKKIVSKKEEVNNSNISISEIMSNLKKYKTFFLKIDIEGNEYYILNDILRFKKKIKTLIIEFHSVHINLTKIKKFVKKLNLTLTHIHPNNHLSVINTIPQAIECTFEYRPKIIGNKKSLPNRLDQNCDKTKNEIFLTFKNV
ncbi:MAG: FkbM family methyltransferase [Candidatus Fonsibacter sp.]|jgi:uncharacterized membrane protein